MSCCKGKPVLPSKRKQITNLVLSVANAIANAIKSGKIVAPEAVVSKRISVCNGCRHLAENRCTVCGCFINIKVGINNEKCPLNHW